MRTAQLASRAQRAFADATRRAVQEAHAANLPTCGVLTGKRVIVYPDGEVRTGVAYGRALELWSASGKKVGRPLAKKFWLGRD